MNITMNPLKSLPLVATLLAVGLLGTGTITLAEESPEEQGFFGFVYEATDRGAKVTEVLPGGGADRAGFQPGDVILAVDGQPLAGLDQISMHEILSSFEAGSRVTVELESGGEVRTAEAPLEATPEEYRVAPEDLARVRRKMAETRAVDQLIRVVERSRLFIVQKTETGDFRLRPDVEGAPWEPVEPVLVKALDQALEADVSDLAPGERVEVRGTLRDHRVDLDIVTTRTEPGDEEDK
jgi:membrane-associated protease RseP (regulator of RpoE activity)